LCEKTTKRAFSLQKAMRQTAQVVAAKGVADSREPNYAKIGGADLHKGKKVRGMGIGDREKLERSPNG